MTVDEVARILGGPPGDYTVFQRPINCGFGVPPALQSTRKAVYWETVQWNGDAGTILLKIDGGKVTLRLFRRRAEGDCLFPDHEIWLTGE
jgi:hypothetical protein